MPKSPVDTTPSENTDKRQPRQSRLVKAALGCARLGKFDVTLRNVSRTGVGGQGPHALTIGERVTLFLPGHEPMIGTVRWILDKRFGVETDRPIEAELLRGAHADQLVAADSKADFQITPAPKMSTWRPGLTQATNLPRHFGPKH